MTIIFTIFEYLVSLIFELIFGVRWWDYTNEFLNINGRVCLIFSLLWGIGSIIFIKIFYNPVNYIILKIREKVNEHIIEVVLFILAILMLVDFVLSILTRVRP